jgi:hypothetical protein
VISVFLGLDPRSLITTRQFQVKVTWAGFEGDKHAGITRWSDGRTPHYPRGTEIRNDRSSNTKISLAPVLVEGLATGIRVTISKPCSQAALHKRGIVACVEKTGIVSEGDGVWVEIPEQVLYTVQVN